MERRKNPPDKRINEMPMQICIKVLVFFMVDYL
jgi:hypothetical protein